MANTSSSVFGHGRPPVGPDPRPIINTQPLEATHLGQKSEYKFEYNPNLLVAVPRQENRNHIGINSSNLPFIGVDVWNAYEWSCLTTNGLPVTGILKLRYSCNSESIVESKSLKLYLFSFNMYKIANTPIECVRICENIIKGDLSKILKTDVSVKIFSNYESFESPLDILNSIPKWTMLDTLYPNISCDTYNETPDIMQIELPDTMNVVGDTEVYTYVVSDLLRSNCKITKQPDLGTIFIYYKSINKRINEESLLKYIVSFRSENHFHEEITESCFTNIYNKLTPEQLVVGCLYTRRGGIDINVFRATDDKCLDIFENYTNINNLSYKSFRQ
jgi:7-cyano-7-deazaguanine reductase